MIRARCKSPDDTRALAGELAAVARPGDVVLLVGELGSGKTQFAKGFGAALGVGQPITSPTFTLVRIYDSGRVLFVHADVYRLDHAQEAVDLALTELLDDGAVLLVEWGDRIASMLPTGHLEVRLEPGDAEDERVVHVRAVGGGAWAARTNALQAALARWEDAPC
jgi:tRNA threonylcarbamoyladenosine biosynthesis protein TsaE